MMLTGYEIFGDLVVDLDVKASRRRYGAKWADPCSRPLQGRRGHAPRRNRAERRADAVEIRRQESGQVRL